MEVVSRKGGENLNGSEEASSEEKGSEEASGEGWKEEDGERVLASISGVRGIDEERR